jgi:hypothetical protein
VLSRGRLHEPEEWIRELGQDADLADVGVVITPERLVELWSHNRAADRSIALERAMRGHARAAKKRQRRSEAIRFLRWQGFRGVNLRIATQRVLAAPEGARVDLDDLRAR